jgi:hypothetical protein
MSPNSKTYFGLHVKCPKILLDFNQIWNLSAYFESAIKFHGNPSSGDRADTSGQTDEQPGEISVEERAFVAIYCRRQQKTCLGLHAMPNIFARL